MIINLTEFVKSHFHLVDCDVCLLEHRCRQDLDTVGDQPEVVGEYDQASPDEDVQVVGVKEFLGLEKTRVLCLFVILDLSCCT